MSPTEGVDVAPATRFRGVFANLPTALSDDGEAFDAGRMAAHVDWLVDEGVHGISCLLSTGGFTYLTPLERRDVVTCVVDAVAGRVAVIAGVTGDSTSATIGFARDADAAGADALLVQPRSYVPLRPDEVLAHFESVANAVDTPIGVYNHPPSTGIDISPAEHVRIIDVTGSVVAKDATDDLANIPAVLQACSRPYGYLWGDVSQLLPALTLGAPGCCTGIASVFPREVVAVHDALAVDGDMPRARAAHAHLKPVIDEISALGSPRASKAAAELRGINLGGQRRPLSAVTPEATHRLRRAIDAAGIEPVTL